MLILAWPVEKAFISSINSMPLSASPWTSERATASAAAAAGTLVSQTHQSFETEQIVSRVQE
jgi:hypothetical protein